jgi:predicted ATPase
VLTGEAGVGKSRLAGRAAKLAALRGWHVISIARPQAFHESELAGIAAIIHELRRGERQVEASSDEGGVASADKYGTDASGMLLQAIAEIAAFLIAATAARRPTLLIIDNYHWLDETSRKVLQAAVEFAGCVPFSTLAVGRDVDSNAWFGDAEFVDVGPLGDIESRELAAKACEYFGCTLSDNALASLTRISMGRPLFIIEAVRDVAQRYHRGEIVRELGRTTGLPASIDRLVRSRFDDLSVDAKVVAFAVALLSEHCTIAKEQHVLEVCWLPSGV